MRDFSGGQRALVEGAAIRLHGRRLSERLMRPAGAAEALEPGQLGVQLADAQPGGESSSRVASRRQNLRCGYSVCMVLSPAFRLLDYDQALCYLKIFAHPPLPFELRPSGKSGQSRMYLNPESDNAMHRT